MKRILVLFFALFISSASFFSYANEVKAVSMCEASLEDKIALANCLKSEIETNRIAGAMYNALDSNAKGFVGSFISYVLTVDFDIDSIEASLSTLSFEGVIKIIDVLIRIAGVLALIYFSIRYLITLFITAKTGVVKDKSVAAQMAFVLILCTAGIFGGLKFVLFPALFISLLILLCFFLVAIAVMADDAVNDTSVAKYQAYIHSKRTASTLINANFQMHFNEIQERNKLVGELSIDSDGVLRDNKFLDCIYFEKAPATDFSFYIPSSILKTSKCTTNRYGYTEFSTGHIKPINENSGTMKSLKALSNYEQEIRTLAEKSHYSHCASIYNRSKATEYAYENLCRDINKDGVFRLDGYRVALIGSNSAVDNSELQAELNVIRDKFAADLYTIYLSYANENIKFDKIKINSNEFYRILYAESILSKQYLTIYRQLSDYEISNKVVVKKNAFQEGVDFASNFIGVGSETKVDFGTDIVIGNILVSEKNQDLLLDFLNRLTKDAGIKIGLQHSDCAESGVCNKGSPNVFATVKSATEDLMPILVSTATIFSLASTYYEYKAEKTKPADIDSKSKATVFKFIASFIASLMFIILGFYVWYFSEFFKRYVLAIFKSILNILLLLAVLPFALVKYADDKVRKDDTYTLNDMMRQFGVYDALLDAFLTMYITIMSIPIVAIVMNFSSSILYNLAGKNVLLFVGENLMTDILSAFIFIVIIISSYCASFVISLHNVFIAHDKFMSLIVHNSNSYNVSTQEAVNKVKEFFNKLK